MASVTFETTVTASGNNTGIVVPQELIERLGAGTRPALIVNVNGYEYRNTVGVMAGKHMISMSAAVRQVTGLKGGDPISVTLTVAETPPEVEMAEDFAAALAADPVAASFFKKLSNSMQRYHVDNVNGAKTLRRDNGASTRQWPSSGRASSANRPDLSASQPPLRGCPWSGQHRRRPALFGS